MNLIPVKYVGAKPSRRCDHVIPGSALVWSPGQVHYLPADMAIKLTAFADVWATATEEDLKDPAVIGYVIDPDDTPVETPEERAEREEAERAAVEALPSLDQLSKDGIMEFARRTFGIRLDATAMKKVDMVKAVRDAAAANASFSKLEAPGTVRVAEELPPVFEPPPVDLTPPVRVEGHVDLSNLPAVPAFTAGLVPEQPKPEPEAVA